MNLKNYEEKYEEKNWLPKVSGSQSLLLRSPPIHMFGIEMFKRLRCLRETNFFLQSA